MAFFDLIREELALPQASRAPASLAAALAMGAARVRAQGVHPPFFRQDAKDPRDPVFSGRSRRLALALFAQDAPRVAAERASGARVAGVRHGSEPLLSIAARQSLPMLQAIWDPRAALDWDLANGMTPWLAVLLQGAPLTIGWMANQMRADGIWDHPELNLRAQGNLTPLMCALHAHEPPLQAALPWISDREFWALDSAGATALDHCLSKIRSPSRLPSADLLLADAASRAKDGPNAKAAWRRWLKIAMAEHLDSGFEWPRFAAACEGEQLKRAMARSDSAQKELDCGSPAHRAGASARL